MGAMGASKIRTFAADGQSDIKILRAIIFTSGAAADAVELKAGGSGGVVFLTYRQPTALASIGQTFTTGVECPTGNWYVEYTGTPGTVTLIGD
jgi:hypothetical protein